MTKQGAQKRFTNKKNCQFIEIEIGQQKTFGVIDKIGQLFLGLGRQVEMQSQTFNVCCFVSYLLLVFPELYDLIYDPSPLQL